MSDVFLATRLQTAMGDAYRLERELPGGGMSRLFVALEASLNRRVVIKVLPPELASDVSAARFKKEIELAAHLQHPHILPILAAGAKDDLLYYVMPFVAGESLRQHLEQNPKMPVEEATRILREVADALGYAHRKGIVHRDIKPENILLEDGHAVLADFGVARAIDEARSGADLPRMTGTGMSVGTPTYMAPEQASGERHIDARADLYALAIVGYEMLAGQLPFSAPSAQAMLAAHLTTPPAPVNKARPDVPANVSAAIAKALAKSPDERYRTAEEFRDALGASAASAAGGGRKKLWIAAAAAIVLAAGALYATWHSRRPLEGNLVAIAPFDVVGADLALWQDGMVDVLSRNLDGAGDMRTVPPSIVIKRWSGHSDLATATELGRATGAHYVVYGLLRGTDTVHATVSVLDVGTGRPVGSDIDVRSLPTQIDRLADSITFALVRTLTRSPQQGAERLSSIGTNSLPALKAFLQGEQFYRQSAWDSARAAYARALAIDSTFALASRGLAQANGWAHGGEDSVTVFYSLRAGRYNRHLSPRDSLLIAADSIESAVWKNGNRPDVRMLTRMFKTLDVAVQRYPSDPVVLYALADAQFHWAWGPIVGLPPEKVMALFDRAIAADSSVSPTYLHAIALAFRLGGNAAGQRYLRAYLAQNPTDAEADAMRLAQRVTDPQSANSPETAHLLDTASNDVLGYGSAALYAYPDSAQTAVHLVKLLSPSRRTQWTPLADTNFERRRLSAQLLNRGRAREGLALGRSESWQEPLVALIGGYPPDSARARFEHSIAGEGCAPCFLPYFAEHGDTAAMSGMLRDLDSLARFSKEPFFKTFAPYGRQEIQGYMQLARHDSAGALRLLQTLPDSTCHACGFSDLTVVQLLEAKGRDREAMDVLNTIGVDNNTFIVLMTFERARVAERLGEKAIAVDGYSHVADDWEFADSAFQPYVKASRDALKRLGGDNAPRIKLGAQ